VELEPRPRDGRAPARRLKDISHLYISSARRPTARLEASTAVRRALELVIAGPASSAVRAEVVANLAVQLARLGRRTVVVDLDPALPNVGFRLALEPAAYLGHLALEPHVRCEPGLLGVRVLVGAAGRAAPDTWPEDVRQALRAAECRLFVGGDAAHTRDVLRALSASAPSTVAPTTFQRAAHHSPMIGAWLATAPRPRSEPAGPLQAITAALWIEESTPGGELSGGEATACGDLPVRTIVWGDADASRPGVWARVPRHPRPHLPLAALEPDHAASRAYEGLAQSLLAGLSGPGGKAHA